MPPFVGLWREQLSAKESQEAPRESQCVQRPSGLCASIWTRNLSSGHKLAQRIKAGSVRINLHHYFDSALPFGGYKESGWGREQGAEALRTFTEVKSICGAL
jgi:phenylacetaldehyde dehydrogenase